jgi:hypothetical protein
MLNNLLQMENQPIITGDTEQEVWNKVEAELAADDDLLTYNVVINQGGRPVELYVDIDLGGGFESGSEITQFSAVLKADSDFRFAIHEEDFLDSIGKFFGLEDVEIGYPELDERLVVKTNNAEKMSQIFANSEIRSLFTDLKDFNFGIHTHDAEDANSVHTYLDLDIEQGITDPQELRKLYHAFYTVLLALEQ